MVSNDRFKEENIIKEKNTEYQKVTQEKSKTNIP